jgi:hypothetical protein
MSKNRAGALALAVIFFILPPEQSGAEPFPQSPATYVIHGDSDVGVRVISTGAVINLHLEDFATRIAASAPFVSGSSIDLGGAFVPAPFPLPTIAPEPLAPPPLFNLGPRPEIHMQVISMIMTDGTNNLLIGLPYAERYPEIFFNNTLFVGGSPAFSFGEMESTIASTDTATVGFPARSYFNVFHILETPFGVFFNKQFSQMELGPLDGHLALEMPPNGHTYDLINGPILLFDVNNPNGPAVAILEEAHHHLIQTTAVIPVSEPSTITLIAIALLVLLSSTYYRNRRRLRIYRLSPKNHMLNGVSATAIWN